MGGAGSVRGRYKYLSVSAPEAHPKEGCSMRLSAGKPLGEDSMDSGAT
jgi:hypothetical protein